MYKEKNYKLWYRMSAALLIAAVLVHISGYFTNMLYVLAWVLWMPVIGLFVICFFDYYTALRLKPAIRKGYFQGNPLRRLCLPLCAWWLHMLSLILYTDLPCCLKQAIYRL